MTTHTQSDIKRIGDTGQVSVGKALAGKLVRVEPAQDGIMLRFVVDVPERDAWWALEPYKSKLKDALAWAEKHPPSETDLDALLALRLASQSVSVPSVTHGVARSGGKRAKKPTPSKRAARKKK